MCCRIWDYMIILKQCMGSSGYRTAPRPATAIPHTWVNMLLANSSIARWGCRCCCLQGVLSLAASPSIGQLQQLNLSHNELGLAAGAGLAELLQKATSLQVLKLNGTQLQDEGGCAFSTALCEGLLAAVGGLQTMSQQQTTERQ
jgi:hypothetical protein